MVSQQRQSDSNQFSLYNVTWSNYVAQTHWIVYKQQKSENEYIDDIDNIANFFWGKHATLKSKRCFYIALVTWFCK